MYIYIYIHILIIEHNGVISPENYWLYLGSPREKLIFCQSKTMLVYCITCLWVLRLMY